LLVQWKWEGPRWVQVSVLPDRAHGTPPLFKGENVGDIALTEYP
jgi:hypothetical protein